MLRHLPNIFTALNMVSGCLGLLSIYKGDLFMGALFILIGAIFDFLDGFIARLLDAKSELGKQLDSLADLVTFGMVPAFLLYFLLEGKGSAYISMVSLLVVISSAIRLARFNIDESQRVSFKGLPTPASAFLVAGLVFAHEGNWQIFSFLYNNVTGLIIFIIAITILLNTPLTFLSFKIRSYELKGNEYIFLLILLSLVCFFLYGFKGILPVTLIYMVLSILKTLFFKNESS